MSQIALPLSVRRAADPVRVVVGNANRAAVDALADPSGWPFGTAILAGPPRSGKSLLARWFEGQGGSAHWGEAVDGADTIGETELFHRWNRAQESGQPLLLVTDRDPWDIALPDLRSRLGAALPLAIGVPDDDMVGAL
ncbi:MAG: ATPase, partial [Tsuneonella sp.]